MPDAERERFEKWAREEFPGLPVNIARSGDGYVDPVADYLWLAWQAALAPSYGRS